ncbi:MAG: leucine-rich repeat domain-containing protein, partial [Bacteroidota bacterium]
RGNLPEMPSAIAQVKLEARGIPVVAAPTGPNCVVVIGDDAELGPEITNNPDIALALPAQLRDFLAREPAPKSTESSHLGPAERGNLRQLLLSDDRDSVRLALNLLEPGELPESLFAELLVQGYFNPEQVISAIVRQFFKRRVPPRTVAFVERYWPFSGINAGSKQYNHRVQFFENISHLPGLDFPHFLGTLLKATTPARREQIDLIARRHLLRLPPEQFHPLASTMIHKQTLDICLLRLREFPEIFFEFPDLEAIEARDNKLTTLPERIGEYSRLVNLDVRHNKIASVPDRLTQLPRLTRLYLAGNQIQQLPERLGDLAELALLDIGFNQLRSLPRSLIDAPRLRELRCFNAFAQGQIPPVIGELTHLKKLQLSENGITRFPEWQPQFTGLTHLDLSYNPIEQLPDWVGSLPELRVLEINHTQIQALPDSLAGATNLTTIYLPKTIHAGLSSIIRVGQQLPHLRELYFPYRLRTLKHHYRLQKALPQVRIQKHQRRPL